MFNEEEIRTITKAVWSIQLQLDLEDTAEEEDELDPFAFAEEMTMTASILITGEWKGAVLFNSSRKLARRAAAIMFDIPESHLEEDHVSDALGEMTSMTAGNLLSLVRGRYTMSLPMVVEGTFHSVRLPGTDIVVEIELVFDGEPLVISVVEKMPDHRKRKTVLPRQP